MSLQTWIFATLTSQPRSVRWDFYAPNAGHSYGYRPVGITITTWGRMIVAVLNEDIKMLPAESHFWTIDRN